MDSWDIEPEGLSQLKSLKNGKSKWEGEDADEDVMDSWDQDDEEQKSERIPPKEELSVKIPNGKLNPKKLGERLEEKQKKKKQESAKKLPDGKTDEELEDQLAVKLRCQKLQEESDLNLAKEVFGALGKSLIESKEDFDILKNEVLKLTSEAAKNANFAAFTEEIINSLAVHLSSVDLKRIHTRLGNLHIEKSKLEKGDKIKKPKSKVKAKLRMEPGATSEFLHQSVYSDYDQDYGDFI